MLLRRSILAREGGHILLVHPLLFYLGQTLASYGVGFLEFVLSIAEQKLVGFRVEAFE